MLTEFPNPALPDRYRFDETRPCGSNSTGALDTAKAALLGMGFALEEASADSLELRGPGWSSTNQPSARAASRIRIEVSGGTLRLRAELLGLRTLDRFVTWFPAVLLLGILGIQSVVWIALGKFATAAPTIGMAGGGMLLLFVPLALVLRSFVRQRARSAMDRLLQSCVAASNAP